MSGPHFDVNLLQNIEPWQWPQEAAKTIRDALSDRQAEASERLIAADLAGDLVVMNDDIAEALIAVVADAAEPVELRAQAAISFGPVLEQTDMDGFDEWLLDDEEPPISKETFDKIRALLRQVHSDPSAPKEVRRRALEAAVRASEEWNRDAIKKAYAIGDREWMLTAVFGMRYIKGFNGPILEALNSKDEEIHFEAINAAGDRELDAAWPHVKALVQNPKTPETLLLAAIEAVSTIRPAETRRVLQHLADSPNEEIAEAAEEAIGMAEALLAGANDERRTLLMGYQREIDFARRIAKAAGANARSIRASGISAESKADASPVTIADRDNERLIREAIEREFPNDGILGEEGSSKAGSSGRRWIIDPIDGTRDFVRGNRFWCVLLALEEASESLVGVAHFPMLDETYWAVQGGGSYLNGERLSVSAIDSIAGGSFSPNGLNHPSALPYLSRVIDVIQRSWSVRTYGGALDGCLLAAGKLEIWFEPKVEPWDLAALKLIIEEAGGVYFAFDGSRSIYRGTAMACAPGVEQEVRQAFGLS